ncbi:MAG: hypothetical protein RL375_3790 [Pseudomonadota bacterium]
MVTRRAIPTSTAAALLVALLACGGGHEPEGADGASAAELAGFVASAQAQTTTARRARKVQVSFYGDSLTANRVAEIADGAFLAADYAVWGQGSYAPLSPTDTSARVVVIRYGMADAIRLMTPAETVANVTALADQVRAQGRRPIIVGMPCLDSDLGAATAQALRAVQDVDVTPGCDPVPRTTDGIHPTPAEHARMDTIIRNAAVAALNDAGL